MHFGIIEYTENGGLREKNGISSFHHGVTPYPAGFTVRLNASTFDVIYFTAYVPGTIVFDLNFPAPLTGKALRGALESELEQRIPVALEEITSGYLRRSRSNRKFRVYAVRNSEVEKILANLENTDLTCDCFLPAQLLLGTDTEEGAALPAPADLLCEYLAHDPGGRNLHLSVDPIPRRLRPVRHRKLRTFFNIAFAVAGVFALLLIGVRLQQALKTYRGLRAENARLTAQYQQVLDTERALQHAVAIDEKLREAQLSGVSPLAVLKDLNARLPVTMFLDSYTQSGNQADIVIKASVSDPNLPRLLLASELYKSEVKKTVQTADNGAVYNVSLKEIKP